MINVDYIIVGQGLAGTAFAQLLIQNNKSFVIVDKTKSVKASKVAIGLFNPVVFKRLTKSWKIDELIPSMDKFYTDAENILSEKFYHKKTIVKFFTEDQERALWLKKSKEAVGYYLEEDIKEGYLSDVINNPNGTAGVKHAGYVDMDLFLNGYQQYFIKNNLLLDEAFEYDQLNITTQGVNYNNINANKIVFCEGHKAIANPYFTNLLFKLTKGEVITIKCPELGKTNDVIKKGVSILPIGGDLFKIGSTTDWEDLTENKTEKGKQELIEKVKSVLKVPFEVVDHRAGIRPTVKDRRPLLGAHPNHPNLIMFNGLGTKGVMLAPFFVKHLYDYLTKQSVLDKEVDISRFD